MNENKNFKNILQKLGAIDITPMLTPLPLNLSEQKELFIRKENYNPQFIYETKSFDTQKRQIEEIEKDITYSGLDNIHQTYLIRISSYIAKLVALNSSCGKDSLFSTNIKSVYNWDLKISTNLENLILKENSLEEIYSAEEIKIKLVEALKLRDLNWAVEIAGPERSDIRVNVAKRVINVGLNARSNPFSISKTIVHEIDTHILRFQNSLKTNLEVVIRGNLPGKILAEEGFAVFNEYKNHLLTKRDLNRYIYRFELCKAGGSFIEIYNKCLDLYKLTPDKAFETAYRLKRGFTDTSSEYIHLKDSSYLKGFDQILSTVKTFEDYKFLFKGRVSLEDKFLFDEVDVSTYDYQYPSWFNDSIVS